MYRLVLVGPTKIKAYNYIEVADNSISVQFNKLIFLAWTALKWLFMHTQMKNKNIGKII